MSEILSAQEAESGLCITHSLLEDGVFRQASELGLARLLPYIAVEEFEPGEYLYRPGQPAQEMFYILDGEAQLITETQQKISPATRRLGEEAGTDFDHYLCGAVAQTPLRVLVIPRKSLTTLFESQPSLKAQFYFSLMHAFAGEHLHPDHAIPASAPHKERVSETWIPVFGWILAFVAPMLMLHFGMGWGLEKNAVYFLAILSTTVVMWVFSLVDEYIPGIFALLATLAMDLVPMPVILSGMASDGFMLAMSVLGLGAVIVASGLSYRLLLMMLMRLPNTPFWQNSAILSIGFMLTPLIPSINGRVALVSPFLSDMLEILRQRLKGVSANQLAISAFTGVSLLSAVFLSSKSMNFVVLGLLPDQIQDQFQWLSWFQAAAITGLVLLVLYGSLAAILLRGHEPGHISPAQVQLQVRLLGRLKPAEWAAIIGVALFMLGVVTTSLHRVPSPWLGMAILFGILLFGVMSKKDFRQKIDWPFLIYLAGVVGIAGAINYLGLGLAIAKAMPWLGGYMHTNFSLFVLALSGVIFVLRLAVPISATIVILATILMPVAVHYGVNPWVVGFIILVLGEMWFFPYQCSYYLQFRQLTKGQVFDERLFLRFNALFNVLKVVAIFASFNYWKGMGLL